MIPVINRSVMNQFSFPECKGFRWDSTLPEVEIKVTATCRSGGFIVLDKPLLL